MRVRIKICGITSVEAARFACESGVDALGFVFSESPRRVTIDQALLIARQLPPFVSRVAVFHHPEPEQVREVVSRFAPHVVQTEPDRRVVDSLGPGVSILPVFHDGEGVIDDVTRYLECYARGATVHLEAAGRGGRGVAPKRDRAAAVARATPTVLAGGLDPDNVAAAIRAVRPRAVDVSSGVEHSPGIKEPGLIERFVEAVARADTRAAGVIR